MDCWSLCDKKWCYFISIKVIRVSLSLITFKVLFLTWGTYHQVATTRSISGRTLLRNWSVVVNRVSKSFPFSMVLKSVKKGGCLYIVIFFRSNSRVWEARCSRRKPLVHFVVLFSVQHKILFPVEQILTALYLYIKNNVHDLHIVHRVTFVLLSRKINLYINLYPYSSKIKHRDTV